MYTCAFTYVCDRICNNRPSSHKLFFLPSLYVAILNSYVRIIAPCIRFSGLMSRFFSGQLLIPCNHGTDTMGPVECTKWMAGLYPQSRWCPLGLMTTRGLLSDVRVFSGKLLCIAFEKLLAFPTHRPTHRPTLLYPGQKLVHTFEKIT